MSSVVSAIKYLSKHGGSLTEDIAADPKFRNLNSDRLRTVFPDKGVRDDYLSRLRLSLNELFRDLPRKKVGGSIYNEDDFLNKTKRIKMYGGGLDELKGAMAEYNGRKNCNCIGLKKRIYNGNYRYACGCNK